MQPRDRPTDVSSAAASAIKVTRFMSEAGANTVVPQEDLEAALAEVEKLSEAEAAAAARSPDDGSDQADDATPGSAEREMEPTTSQTEDAPAPAPAEASPSAEEVDAKLKEVEALAADAAAMPAEAGPDEATSAVEALAPPTSVHRQDAGATPDEAQPCEPAGKGASEGSQSPQETSATGAPPTPKKVRFKIGQKAREADVAEHRPPDQSADAALSAARPVASLFKRLCRAIDQGLEAVNRPFGRLGDGGRALVGWAALATLIVSILAMILMPMILPHRDALTFLQEKRVQLEPPPADEPTDSTP